MAKLAVILQRPNTRCAMRDAFAQGLDRRGWSVERLRPGQPLPACDLFVTWGTRSGFNYYPEQRARGGEIVVLERAYVGDRFVWTSVSKGGGLNNRGVFIVPDDGGDRWRKHHPDVMQPWRPKSAGKVLLMGQIPTDMSVRNSGGIDRVYESVKADLRARGLSVKYRPHPGSAAGQVYHHVPLARDLEACRFSISYNSNSSVDSVLAGVPTITLDRGAMAWDVSGHDLFSDPPTPDRAAWAHWLAWTQYLPAETSSGFCQEVIGL